MFAQQVPPAQPVRRTLVLDRPGPTRDTTASPASRPVCWPAGRPNHSPVRRPRSWRGCGRTATAAD